MNYKEEKKFLYDIRKYKFIELFRDVLNCEDLQQVHKKSGVEYKLFDDPLKDSETEFHKAIYDKLRSGWPEFLDSYKSFIENEVAPSIQTKKGLIYQKWPTFRFNLPNNVAVGGWHTDGEYNHPPNEINFIVPMTPMFESNATIAESEPGKRDFHQIECVPGEYVRFNGNECMHGNIPNKTGVTRVSFDFRVMRIEDYDTHSKNKSLTMGKDYKIGGYYEKL